MGVVHTSASGGKRACCVLAKTMHPVCMEKAWRKNPERETCKRKLGALEVWLAFGRQKVKLGNGMITYVFSRENQLVVWVMNIIDKVMELERPTQSYVFIKEEQIN